VDLSSVRNAIERYARAVQEADVEELRRITFGVLREQLSLEKTRLIVAQLAADTCQHGAISVRDFRDAYFDADQWKITATVAFEHAPPLDVRFGLIELQGRCWARRRRHSARRSEWITGVLLRGIRGADSAAKR